MDAIGVVGKAVIVVDHSRVLAGGHGERRLLPVARDHQHGLGSILQLLPHVDDRLLERIEYARLLVLHPWPRPATVADEISREGFAHVSPHGDKWAESKAPAP